MAVAGWSVSRKILVPAWVTMSLMDSSWGWSTQNYWTMSIFLLTPLNLRSTCSRYSTQSFIDNGAFRSILCLIYLWLLIWNSLKILLDIHIVRVVFEALRGHSTAEKMLGWVWRDHPDGWRIEIYWPPVTGPLLCSGRLAGKLAPIPPRSLEDTRQKTCFRDCQNQWVLVARCS